MIQTRDQKYEFETAQGAQLYDVLNSVASKLLCRMAPYMDSIMGSTPCSEVGHICKEGALGMYQKFEQEAQNILEEIVRTHNGRSI